MPSNAAWSHSDRLQEQQSGAHQSCFLNKQITAALSPHQLSQHLTCVEPRATRQTSWRYLPHACQLCISWQNPTQVLAHHWDGLILWQRTPTTQQGTVKAFSSVPKQSVTAFSF